MNPPSLVVDSSKISAGSRRYVHYGNKFSDAHVGFASALATGHQHADDPELLPSFSSALGKVSGTFRDLHELSRDAYTLTEQSLSKVVQSNEEELRRVKEAKRRFAESDEAYSTAVRRAHQVRKQATDEVTQTADRDFIDKKCVNLTSPTRDPWPNARTLGIRTKSVFS